jgi:hypothetical protein
MKRLALLLVLGWAIAGFLAVARADDARTVAKSAVHVEPLKRTYKPDDLKGGDCKPPKCTTYHDDRVTPEQARRACEKACDVADTKLHYDQRRRLKGFDCVCLAGADPWVVCGGRGGFSHYVCPPGDVVCEQRGQKAVLRCGRSP